ncbi:MAG: hypothetical protein NVSMB18_20580 [Acetobacteraceae bacterium]
MCLPVRLGRGHHRALALPVMGFDLDRRACLGVAMKKTLIAAATISLMAGYAFAGEGGGDPFAFRTSGAAVVTAPYAHSPSASQNPFPFTVPSVSWNTVPVLPTNGANAIVQTANSLPVGFENGTPAYEFAQQVQAYWQTQAPRPVIAQASHTRG